MFEKFSGFVIHLFIFIKKVENSCVIIPIQKNKGFFSRKESTSTICQTLILVNHQSIDAKYKHFSPANEFLKQQLL